MSLAGKSVAIIGGGQTGVEVFRNSIHGKWGRAKEIHLFTRRKSLEPLDESAFTNEYFTPNYVDAFWSLNPEKKAHIVSSQKLASDGNTPAYLAQLYNDLYRLKHVDQDARPLRILACRKLVKVVDTSGRLTLGIENAFSDTQEQWHADVVILCTGFESLIPKVLEPLFPRIPLDSEGRFKFKKSYAIEWEGPSKNRIYALNFSRHNHGIIDPQMSLMAWRSAVVVNDLIGEPLYATNQILKNFVEYETLETQKEPM